MTIFLIMFLSVFAIKALFGILALGAGLLAHLGSEKHLRRIEEEERLGKNSR